MIVDAHNHVIPRSIVDLLTSSPEPFGVTTDNSSGAVRMIHREGFAYPLFDEFVEPAEKLRQLDQRGFDKAVISPSPTLFFYRIEGARNAEFVRRVNEEVAAFAAVDPTRMLAMGTLPMQSPEASIAELDHLVNELGIRSVMIGCHIDGVQLAAPQFRDVLRRAEELDVFILAHPYYFGAKPGLEDYYLTNLIGNPLDTAVMAAHLIFGGVMDELPELKICLSHAGGFVPYQIGRLVHGWNVRREAKTTTSSPKDLLRRFYFDTITHDSAALQYLIGFAGEQHVLLGTDLPFDMADVTPVSTLRGIDGLSEEAFALISGGNALRLIGA
jgi:aminocarboxymuconate-semialdehyde decarboxylase